MSHHVVTAFSVAFALCCTVAPAQEAPAQRTYAIRVGDKIVGYQTEVETPRTESGRELIELRIESLAKIEMLGSSIDQRIDQTWTLDAPTRAALRVTSTLDAGTMRTVVTGELVDAGFSFSTDEKGATPQVVDQATTVVSPEFGWLLRRGPKELGKVVEVDYLMPEWASVQKARLRLVAAEQEVDELGKKVLASAWSIELPDAGMTFTVFVTPEGRTVRYELPAANMIVEAAPRAVVERIQRIDLTHMIVSKTNLDLDDPTPLTYMKVRVVAETTSDVTVEQLSAPGQTFTGTVTDGRVDGVFEIRTSRSDGQGAPAFPPPAGTFGSPELQQYLQPGPRIESDDPAIVARARELVAGAVTCHEVVERFAEWVHENITYAIPGGVTAARTMELRQGDCGGHSNVLAAMLRAVGIPARTPMGAMYVPLYGGSFGQHMWNEVWLGEAIGWLPLDCTAGQATFVDASHIRLAEGMTAFRPQSVEVLEWEPKSARGPAALQRRQDAYPWQVGEVTTWTWRRGGKELGTERMTYEGSGDGGHVFTSALDLAGGRFVETVRTVVGGDGRVHSLRAERKTGGTETMFGVQIDGLAATVTQQGGAEERKDVLDIEADTGVLHNNCIAHFAILASRIGELADGAEGKIRLVHDESHSVLSLQLRGRGAAVLEIAGEQVPVTVVAASLAGLEIDLHVDRRGRLVRYTQKLGDVVVERTQP